MRVCFLVIISLLLSRGTGLGAVVFSQEGGGGFPTYVDVVNRWITESRLDVMVLVEVSTADLVMDEAETGLVGRLRIEVNLEGLDGQVVQRKRPIRTSVLSRQDSETRTLFQVFGVVLEDVPMRAGRLVCRVYDVNRRRSGIANEMRKQNVSSETVFDWAAEDSPEIATGITVGDPLFLTQAPLKMWAAGAVDPTHTQGGQLHDYMHPSRRYGVEQDHLQVFLPIWPAAEGGHAPAPTGLRVDIVSQDMAYTIIDTIGFDDTGLAALQAGRPAGLFYSLDVNLLPEGAYRVGFAPLDGQGRGVLSGFDVIWRLAAIARQRSQVLGEGRTVLGDRELKNFVAASPAEQEKILNEFWESVNPDPENPVNTAYLEFQYRLAYVRRFLGGFDENGALDPRGEVFLMLGPPDEVQSDHMPMNYRDQDDARIKVFERFAPDRAGTSAKGSPIGGTGNNNPYLVEGGIPMPYSERAEAQRGTSSHTAAHHFAFELWKYDRGGKPLFDNRFTRTSMGTRFLFVDRTGTGDYFLESSNVVQGEE